MDFKKEFKCNCGKTHRCEIKKVIIEENALEISSKEFEKYNNILFVADENTYNVYKDKLSKILKENMSIYIFKTKQILVPNEDAIKQIEDNLNKNTDLLVGIGSGVINDLCKWVSFKHKLPYFIIVSAPSMDGYASSVSALIINNMKVTYKAHAPEVIIGDVEVLKDAPIDMIKAGYGDIIGKYSALNDWKISAVINDEYFCEEIYEMTNKYLLEIVNLSDKILKRDVNTIKVLMESLVAVGIAMSYVENSRPASGSEHHIAHFLEISGILNNEKYLYHGLDVLYGTFLTSKIREEILKLDLPKYSFDKVKWKEEIKKIYNPIYDEIIQLQEKAGWINKDLNKVYLEKWVDIKKVLSKMPSSEEIEKLMNKVNLNKEYFIDFYGEDKIEKAIKYSKYLKDRFTVLWLNC